MTASENIETAAGDRGVVAPGHPPMLDTIILTDETLVLNAGVILRKSDGVDTFQPAAPADTLTEGDACVLVQDTDGKCEVAQAIFHGTVVSGRLIDASGEDPVAAGDTLKGKLPAIGIHLTQLFVGDVK